MFFFQTNHLHFSAEFLGRVRLVGSIASLAGVGTYNYLLKDVPLTKMFFWTAVLGTGLGLTQLILITGDDLPCDSSCCSLDCLSASFVQTCPMKAMLLPALPSLVCPALPCLALLCPALPCPALTNLCNAPHMHASILSEFC